MHRGVHQPSPLIVAVQPDRWLPRRGHVATGRGAANLDLVHTKLPATQLRYSQGIVTHVGHWSAWLWPGKTQTG